jgi:hypothetical protein
MSLPPGALPFQAYAPILRMRQLHNTNANSVAGVELMSDAGLERQTMSRVSRRLLHPLQSSAAVAP